MHYNAAHYNDQRYNIDGTFHVTSLSETMSESDATQLADAIKALDDSIAAFDTAIFFGLNPILTDFIGLDAELQIQISNKALNDIIRLSDWLSIERNPSNNEWYS